MANESTPGSGNGGTDGAVQAAADAYASVDKTNVTLDKPKQFCPYGGMLGGKESQWNARTASLLRNRLLALGILYNVVSVGAHFRDFFIDVGFSLTFPRIVLATMILMTAYLWWEKSPPLIKCRFLEAYFIAAPVSTLIYIDSMLMIQSAPDPGLVIANWYRFMVHMALVIAAYTVFIPAGWKRTATVSTILAVIPFVALHLLMARVPAIDTAIRSGMTAEIYTGQMIAAVMLIGIAAWGTYTIEGVRQQAANIGFAGQYTLSKKLGSGGMGDVWLAKHRLLTRPAAIKVIRPEVLRKTGGETGDGHDAAVVDVAMKRFEREAQATASLTSPHTIQLYDFGLAQDGTFFYVMEYLNGLDFDTLVDEHGPVPVERAVHLLTQAAESLADAHEHGMIHRDIKPSNIFATRMGISDDFVKVLDFGLVKETDMDEGATALTQQGMTSGTPAFMPPEIALAKDHVDQRADIYALACVGFWLTTGQYVFPGDSPMEMVVDHVKSEPDAPSTRTEMPVPREFDDVILRALAKDPAVRFDNMRDFAEALKQVPVGEPWSPDRASEWWKLHPVKPFTAPPTIH